MPSASKNIIRWFESPALDKPELKSPQPCKRGIHCDYKLTDQTSGQLVRACCSGVHPGEEGTGRRLFPARILDDGREHPACVRLTGASQGFYERRRLRMSWADWCEQNGWPFTPALPGQPFEPVVRVPLGGNKAMAMPKFKVTFTSYYPGPTVPAQLQLDPRMMSRGFLGMQGGAEAKRVALVKPNAAIRGSAEWEDEWVREYDEATMQEPRPPSPIQLSGSGRPNEKWAVSSRGGECSPDCCCPTGISCHDRIVPLVSHKKDEQDDESGFVSPKLTTPLSSKGDFENLD